MAVALAVAGLAADDPGKAELAKHQGTWAVISFEREGQRTPRETLETIKRVVEGDKVVWSRDGTTFAETTLEVDPSRDPKTLDVVPTEGRSKGKRVLGIYKLVDDELTICMAGPDKERPRAFEAGPGSGNTLMVFRRERS
jgi:uncharacterized protein (TIGR03067 family)